MSMRRTLSNLATAAALVLGGCALVPAQDSSQQTPSLGDIARKSRKEHAATNHVPAKQVVSEEEDGPDPGGVWRLHACTYSPCIEVSISLPKTLKWSRTTSEPRPVLVELKGNETDPVRVIRIYPAETQPSSLYVGMYRQEGARRTLLQELFARPEYFGQAAHIVRDEHMQIGSHAATISHFTVADDTAKYRGLAIASAGGGTSLGFACVYREQDTKDAASVCEGIINSATIEAMAQYRPQVHAFYPTQPPAFNPQYYDPNEQDRPEQDPIERDPGDDSPED